MVTALYKDDDDAKSRNKNNALEDILRRRDRK